MKDKILRFLDDRPAPQSLAAICERFKARKGDVESLRYLRDTIGEKPRDGLEIGNLDGKPLATIDMSTLTDDELRALIAAREQSDEA